MAEKMTEMVEEREEDKIWQQLQKMAKPAMKITFP
jgi:hypothetical protein